MTKNTQKNTKIMKTPDIDIVSALNDELLDAVGCEKDVKQTDPGAKRNSKDEIIQKIVKCAEENNITVEHSNTKLRRMTKPQLNQLLVDTVEKSMQCQMAQSVGVSKNATEKVIALGALRMIHNMLANATEQGLNAVLPAYGYEIRGFARSMESPPVNEAVNACLEEIARDSDILSYVESPYARLGIAWSGALMTSLQTKHNYPNIRQRSRYAAPMGPPPSRNKNPVQPSPVRREEDGKE